METTTIPVQQKQYFDGWQLYLQWLCLACLGTFGESHQDRKFLSSKEVFPLAVDTLLLQPPAFEEKSHNNIIARRIVLVHEKALGPFGK